MSELVHPRLVLRCLTLCRIFFFVLSLPHSTVLAQIDTTLREYFPMHVGDYWEYLDFPFGDDPWSARITGDTLMPNGRTYYVFSYSGGAYRCYFRMDDSLRVFRYVGDTTYCVEFISLDLAATDSSFWHVCLDDDLYYSYYGFTTTNFVCYPYLDTCTDTRSYTGVYIDPYTGDTVWSSKFYGEEDFAKGLGLVRTQAEASPEYHLVGAIIDSVVYGTVSSVRADEEGDNLGTGTLIQNYPNPFNARTTITYEVQQRARVRLSVLNVLGQVETILFDGIRDKGLYKTVWEATNLPSGVYFYGLTVGSYVRYNKAILLK